MLVMQYKAGTPQADFSDVSLLLKNETIYDSSSYAQAVSVQGSAYTTDQAKFGTQSVEFDGSGDPYLTANGSNYPGGAYDFGTGDFTIEAWVYPRAAHPGPRDVNYDMTIFGKLTSSPPLYFFLVSDTLAAAFWDGTTQHTSSIVVSTNVWTHVAVSRNSGTMRIFVNGVQGYAGASSINFTSIGSCFVGGHGQITAHGFDGYIDELRVTTGAGIYTGTFPAPTSEFPTA